MKSVTIITAMLMVTGVSFSQVTPTTTQELPAINPTRVETEGPRVKPVATQEVRKSTTVTISKRPGEAQRTHDAAYFNEEIAKIDVHVSAIDTKIESVNADPIQKSEAEANGWFDDMNRIKSELAQSRAELVAKRDNL